MKYLGSDVASGGTETTYGGYRIHHFTSSGTFALGANVANLEILIVGGGGAGGMRTSQKTLSALGYTITVGAGGGSMADGTDSTFSGTLSHGGVRGGRFNDILNGNTGGSGGGGGGCHYGQTSEG